MPRKKTEAEKLEAAIEFITTNRQKHETGLAFVNRHLKEMADIVLVDNDPLSIYKYQMMDEFFRMIYQEAEKRYGVAMVVKALEFICADMVWYQECKVTRAYLEQAEVGAEAM